MKPKLLLLLMLFCNVAIADWVKVTSSGSGAMTYYIESTQITRSGTLRRAWEMVDLASADSDGMLSMRGLLEFDCQSGQVRWLSETWYSGRMGSGRVIREDNSTREWRTAKQSSSGLTVFRYVCSN